MPAKPLHLLQSSALSAAACLCIAATPAKAEPWRSSVELYGPVPLRLDTTTTVVTQNNRSVTTEAVLNLGQVLDNLQWITAVRGSVEKGRWGVLTDLSYTKLSQENGATTPNELLTGRASVNVSQGIYDLAVRYRFGEPEAAVGTPGQFSLIPYAGIRVIDAQMDVAAQVDLGNILSVQRQGNFGRTWAQPLLGTQASLFLSPRLRAFARADIGGFGLGGAKGSLRQCPDRPGLRGGQQHRSEYFLALFRA